MAFTSLYDLLSRKTCDIGKLADRIQRGELHWHDDYGRLGLAGDTEMAGALAALAKHYEMTQAVMSAKITSNDKADDYSRWWTHIGEHGNDLAAVVRSGFIEGFQPKDEETLAPRERSTLLAIIGALVELMLGKSPGGVKQSVYNNQSAIIDALVENYKAEPGISKRTLEEKFAAGKQTLTKI